jgi:tetratricopeptide (TPR) repeat protein
LEFWYFVVFLADAFIGWQLVNSALEGGLGAFEVAAALLALLGLNGLMLKHATDPLGVALAFSIVAFALLQRVLGRVAEEAQLAVLRAQDLAECRRMIEQRPDLPYPYRVIGDYFFERRMWDEAIGYYERFLALEKDPETRWKLDYAKEEKWRQEKGLKLCPYCRNNVPREARSCPLCGKYVGGLDLSGFWGGSWRLEAGLLGLLAVLALIAALVKILQVDARYVWGVLLPVLAMALLYRRLLNTYLWWGQR